MPPSGRPLSIVLANGSLVGYPTAGGHWSVFLQYLLGLLDLGVDATYVEFVGKRPSDGDVAEFFDRMGQFGLADRALVVTVDEALRSGRWDAVTSLGRGARSAAEVVAAADSVWNMCASIDPDVLMLFRHRVLVDLDPGILQSAAAVHPQVGTTITAHDAHVTVGAHVGTPGCGVPDLGLRWQHIFPFVCLSRWRPAAPSAPADAALTSVTQWNWSGDDVLLDGRVLSASKRLAYLRYVAMPVASGRRFQLAANIDPTDDTGDLDVLRNNRWELRDPNVVASTPEAFGDYIASSLAEFACCKPVYRELNTGWLSDRSVAYLASGRPVVAEDTGFAAVLPTGRGLIPFSSYEEALAAVDAVVTDPGGQGRAARDLVGSTLNSRVQLGGLLAALY